MQLFYNPDLDKDTTQITFDKVESRHIVKVLRKKEGDKIYITNGKGTLFISQINIANDKKCLASIFNTDDKKKSRDYNLHIAIAPTKNNDRLEWFLEKATEIGIDEITPIICDNSERKIIKPERLEKILIVAMKQSLQYHLPKLNESISFAEFISKKQESIKLIAHCEETEKQSLKANLKPKQDVLILIGPEGDFSSKEIELANQFGFTPITLGENRLRTETAALVAAQNVAFLNQ